MKYATAFEIAMTTIMYRSTRYTNDRPLSEIAREAALAASACDVPHKGLSIDSMRGDEAGIEALAGVLDSYEAHT